LFPQPAALSRGANRIPTSREEVNQVNQVNQASTRTIPMRPLNQAHLLMEGTEEVITAVTLLVDTVDTKVELDIQVLSKVVMLVAMMLNMVVDMHKVVVMQDINKEERRYLVGPHTNHLKLELSRIKLLEPSVQILLSRHRQGHPLSHHRRLLHPDLQRRYH
jgi:hypothetical protein